MSWFEVKFFSVWKRIFEWYFLARVWCHVHWTRFSTYMAGARPKEVTVSQRRAVIIGDGFAESMGDYHNMHTKKGLANRLTIYHGNKLSKLGMEWQFIDCGKSGTLAEDWLPVADGIFEKTFTGSGLGVEADIVLIMLGSEDCRLTSNLDENVNIEDVALSVAKRIRVVVETLLSLDKHVMISAVRSGTAVRFKEVRKLEHAVNKQLTLMTIDVQRKQAMGTFLSAAGSASSTTTTIVNASSNESSLTNRKSKRDVSEKTTVTTTTANDDDEDFVLTGELHVGPQYLTRLLDERMCYSFDGHHYSSHGYKLVTREWHRHLTPILTKIEFGLAKKHIF